MTNKNQHIPSGYKPSPLGIIPEDWEVKRLGEVCDIDKESLSNKTDPNYEFDYISLSDVDSDCFETTTSKQTFRTAPSRARRIVKQGDVIISTVRPNLQAFTLIKDKVKDLIVSTGFAVLTPKQIISEYLYQYVFSFPVSKQFYQLVVGSNYPAVNSSDVSHLKIAFPPLSEQKSIIDVLEVWDTAIAKQTALIEQLTLRKRGLMQQLLTGKKRLKGFEGEWKKCAIKSFAKEVSIKNTYNKDYIVLSCTKYDGLVPSLEYFGKQIYSNDLSTYKVVPKNHFAYATNHIEEGSIGYQAQYDNGLISPMYTVFKTDKEKIDNTYFFAVLKSHHLIHLYQAMMEGSINRRGGLRWDSFSTIKVDLPSLEEQKAISAFLYNADKEIEIQKQKLAAMQEQKKGLMQVLLTGKKRIKTK